MKNIFDFLKSFSALPLDVDKLLISSFLDINKLQVTNNQLLKSYSIKKEKTEEFDKLSEFIKIVKSEIDIFDIERLIELFEFVISPSDRIVNGAIYTPSKIREYIVTHTFPSEGSQIVNAKIADIACGCSGFLYTAAQKLKLQTNSSYQDIFQNQIFGLDIQEYSITRSKLLLSLLALSEGEDIEEFHFNLHQGDALTFRWEDHYENFRGFQIIIGNPPYACSRHLSDKTKKLLSNWSVSRTGHPDLYIPFFQIALENLSNNGTLGYITMNSFFKSLNGRALREYFQEQRFQFKIIDFGSEQIFNTKNTYTCICLINKTCCDYLEYTKLQDSQHLNNELVYNPIRYSILDFMKGWNLQDHNIASKIESIGIPLGNLFKSRHGIATLKNKVYIFKPIEEDDNYYYLKDKDSKITYPIERSICKDVINSNKLSSKKNIDDIRQKIIFPYKDYTGISRAQILEESELKRKFPNAYTYLDSKRKILSLRDKGKGQYESWFAFGRTQSLEKMKIKLFFPKMSNKPPSCIINSEENLLFYNGQAIIGESEEELLILKKILESKLFWYYIKTTSKPYSSEYFSLNGNYINNFGIYQFTEEQKKYILSLSQQDQIDSYLFQLYEIDVL